MRWLSDSRTLAFSWTYSAQTQKGSLQLLDTTAPGANLLAGRAGLSLTNPAGKFLGFVISEDGQVLIGTSRGASGVVSGRRTAMGDVITFSARTGAASYLYRPHTQSGVTTLCEDPEWVSPSGRQALLTCLRNGPGGRHSQAVLLLGQSGATRLRHLEPVAYSFPNLIAFGN